MYAIRCLCHRTDISMGCHGFCIDVSPQFKDAVTASKIDQAEIDWLIANIGRTWLDCTGFDDVFDPDEDPIERMERHECKRKPGPNARKTWGADSIRVSWGEWGPQHISVPGNACGLDISDGDFGCVFDNGRVLEPHNVDSLGQKYLLLIVFTEIAETVLWQSRDLPHR